MRSSYESCGGTLIGFGMLVTAVVGLDFGAGVLADSRYGSDKATAYLEQSGYTNPYLEDTHRLFVGLHGCDQTDQVEYGFNATAQNGDNVHILVCKGILKGATIRQG